MDYREFIAIKPGRRNGQPSIRGMRLTVKDVVEYLAGGTTAVEVRRLTRVDLRTYARAWRARPT
jgi:uncharacterized protein (DUF433 family)